MAAEDRIKAGLIVFERELSARRTLLAATSAALKTAATAIDTHLQALPTSGGTLSPELARLCARCLLDADSLPSVKVAPDVADVAALVSDASFARVVESKLLDRVLDTIEGGNVPKIARMLGLLVRAGLITTQERDAITTALGAL